MSKSYNTFVAVNTRNGKPMLVTSSARKANAKLAVGMRIEVWNCNEKSEIIYNSTRSKMGRYIEDEKNYIADKQAKATAKNLKRERNRLRRNVHL